MWKPDETVGQNEYIGRRLFGKKPLKGAADQTRPRVVLELYHFQEKRDSAVSVDRMGANSVDKKVKKYLDPRAEQNAKAFSPPVPFLGWAVVRPKNLYATPKEPFALLSSPLPAEAGVELSGNDYHAHIERPQKLDSTEMAVMLKFIFERDYLVEPPLLPTVNVPQKLSRFQWFIDWVLKLIRIRPG
jgi:hypothetical protein